MSTPSSIINALVSGGVFAALGGVAAATVNAVSGRGESRAKAADALAKASREVAEGASAHTTRIAQDNAEIRNNYVAMRESARTLTDVVAPLLAYAPADLADKAACALADVRAKL